MAIEPVMADVIRKLAPGLPNRRVLSLGYPDVLTNDPQRTDADTLAVARWHHWHGDVKPATEFFHELDLEAEYWDVTQARGPERIVDLNTVLRGLDPDPSDPDAISIEKEWSGIYVDNFETRKFALLIDPGTIEHIVNIGICWRTICAVTAVGGYVVHANPLNMPNHAFYAINPTAYADMYEANGFEIVTMQELSGPLDNRTRRIAPHVSRFTAAPNAVMLCVARKRENVAFRWPIQSKYRANPTLKAAQ